MLLGIELGQVLKSVKVTTRPIRESTSTTCWLGLQNKKVGRLLVRGRFASPNAAMVASAAAAASAARFLQPDIAAWSQNRLMRAAGRYQCWQFEWEQASAAKSCNRWRRQRLYVPRDALAARAGQIGPHVHRAQQKLPAFGIANVLQAAS